MTFEDALAFIRRWCAETGGDWTVADEGDWFRLLYRRGKILYCTPGKRGLSAWVDICLRDDERELCRFGASLRGYQHGPSRSKQGLRLNDVSDLVGLLAWCKREAPSRPLLPLRARTRHESKVGERRGPPGRKNSTTMLFPPVSLHTLPPVQSVGDGSLEARIRAIVEPGWPHDYAETVSALKGVCPFDEFPPVYFVGNLRVIQPGFVLIIGMNPNIRDEEERSLVKGGFEQYWESRIRYFVGDSFYQGHYRPHAAFVAGFMGHHSAPMPDQSGQILDGSALAIDVCPLSSRNMPKDRLLDRWLKRREHPVFRVAAAVLSEVARKGRPAHVLLRYQRTADRLLPLLERAEPDQLMIGGSPIPFSILSGQGVSSREAFRLGLAARLSGRI